MRVDNIPNIFTHGLACVLPHTNYFSLLADFVNVCVNRKIIVCYFLFIPDTKVLCVVCLDTRWKKKWYIR